MKRVIPDLTDMAESGRPQKIPRMGTLWGLTPPFDFDTPPFRSRTGQPATLAREPGEPQVRYGAVDRSINSGVLFLGRPPGRSHRALGGVHLAGGKPFKGLVVIVEMLDLRFHEMTDDAWHYRKKTTV